MVSACVMQARSTLGPLGGRTSDSQTSPRATTAGTSAPARPAASAGCEKQTIGSGESVSIVQPAAASALRSSAVIATWWSTIAAIAGVPSSASVMSTLSPMHRRDHCRECW